VQTSFNFSLSLKVCVSKSDSLLVYNGNLYDMSVNVTLNLYFTCQNLSIETLLI
jgi:hypothetical protein